LIPQEQRKLEELNANIQKMRERLSRFSTSRSEVCIMYLMIILSRISINIINFNKIIA